VLEAHHLMVRRHHSLQDVIVVETKVMTIHRRFQDTGCVQLRNGRANRDPFSMMVDARNTLLWRCEMEQKLGRRFMNRA
jgi:hypothetical protein